MWLSDTRFSCSDLRCAGGRRFCAPKLELAAHRVVAIAAMENDSCELHHRPAWKETMNHELCSQLPFLHTFPSPIWDSREQQKMQSCWLLQWLVLRNQTRKPNPRLRKHLHQMQESTKPYQVPSLPDFSHLSFADPRRHRQLLQSRTIILVGTTSIWTVGHRNTNKKRERKRKTPKRKIVVEEYRRRTTNQACFDSRNTRAH